MDKHYFKLSILEENLIIKGTGRTLTNALTSLIDEFAFYNIFPETLINILKSAAEAIEYPNNIIEYRDMSCPEDNFDLIYTIE